MSSRDTSSPATKSPEEWLEKVAPEKTRGTFKLFLGYAPGVGKTYSMLSEAIRRHQRGEDIVIGVVEAHGRPRTAELAEQLEKIPRRKIEYKGVLYAGLMLTTEALVADIKEDEKASAGAGGHGGGAPGGMGGMY